jgi:hypothetical protein
VGEQRRPQTTPALPAGLKGRPVIEAFFVLFWSGFWPLDIMFMETVDFVLFCFVYLFLKVLDIELKVLHLLGKHSTT